MGSGPPKSNRLRKGEGWFTKARKYKQKTECCFPGRKLPPVTTASGERALLGLSFIVFVIIPRAGRELVLTLAPAEALPWHRLSDKCPVIVESLWGGEGVPRREARESGWIMAAVASRDGQ